jgi:hypothetical protein
VVDLEEQEQIHQRMVQQILVVEQVEVDQEQMAILVVQG